jgi:pSer/pThr/pTyr-binding forkhead associated (FHA) protein/class 3 adenylate cyclase
VLELLVVEGRDTGRQFTVDADELVIGHASKIDDRPVGIHLNDPTVSSKQAVLRAEPDEGFVIEHWPDATNPTRLNGEPVVRKAIHPGDRIEMGHVAISVRPHDGMALSGLYRVPDESTERKTSDRRMTSSTPTPVTSVAVPVEPSPAAIEDATNLSGFFLQTSSEGTVRRYALRPGINKVGRHSSCEIRTPDGETSVSRHHADVIQENDKFFLVHRSATNATNLNGRLVTGRVAIEVGDVIELAGSLVLEFCCTQEEAAPPPEGSGRNSLRHHMEDFLDLEQRIEEEFAVMGTFLDVDIAGSSTMKTEKIRPEHIILSFERWRGWIRRVIEELGGQVLCSNGDELMCFFEADGHADRAVQAGSGMLDQLAQFNNDENLLPEHFRMRIGIHTGRSLVDRRMGIAYSSVLDVAGHLQKEATVNGLLASKQTYEAMSKDHLLELEGELEREGIPTFRLRQ